MTRQNILNFENSVFTQFYLILEFLLRYNPFTVLQALNQKEMSLLLKLFIDTFGLVFDRQIRRYASREKKRYEIVLFNSYSRSQMR